MLNVERSEIPLGGEMQSVTLGKSRSEGNKLIYERKMS
jgi:hypothetical protein